MKYNYPKPTRAQRVKHLLYWVFVGLTFIPFIIFLGAGGVAEAMDSFLGKVRRWCFTERYIKL